VNPTSTNGTAPAFAIGSSTATSFVVTNAGNVGIGTTSQLAKLTVDGSIILPNNNSYRMLDNAGNGVSILTMSTANNVGYSGSTVSGSMQFSVPNATGAFQFLTGAGLTNVLQITNAGNVGIGTTTPFAKLSIAGAAGGTTNLFAISTSTAGFATSTAVKVDSNGNLSLLNGTTLTTPALTVGSLNGLLKGTAGVVSTATAGTDYVAGGAGAATTTLSTSGVLSFNANPVVFGSSPISLSITQSGSGADGYLSSTDWTSFNSRLSTSTFALLKDWNITTNIFGQSSLTPTTTLNIAVSGTGTSTFAGGLEAWRQISAPYFVATSSTATSTFQGGALLALAGGNVGIGTANPTAGLELGSITAGRNQIINATEGPEMAPALEAANWTASDGWSAGGGSLVKIAGVGTGTITPSGTFTVVAGRTYKVVVTLSAASGNLYDQVGGVAGRENLAAGTHTQYITAITSGKIIFTAGAAVTGTITSLSVKELTPGTGDLTVNGKLTLMSGIYSSAGVGAIDINSELGTIGLAGAKASTAGYGLNVTGNILASANIYATGFSYQSTSYLYLSEAANTASIRNSTSQQTLRTYNTYTDASNYERSALSGVQGQSVNITAETAGTGADNLNIVLTPSGTGYTLLNGNVGIGTTSPYRKLSVQGDAGISGNLSAANVVATGTLNVSGQTTLATSLSGLLKATAGVVSTAVAGTDYLTSAFQNWGLTTNIFGQSSLAPTTTQNIAVSGIGTSTFAGGLEAWRSISAPYFVATSTTATSTFNGGALFAVSGGNVGIGTISPSLKLTVAGGQILVGPADSTNSFINFYNTNYKIGASTGLELYTNTSDRIRFIEGSTERARFDAGGNFGIGTTSPYAKLSVVGQIVGAYFTGTTTATSTFGGSLAVTEVNATSTFAGGIDLSDGCYAIDGNCIGVPGSDGTVNTGAAGYFAYYPSAGTTVDDQTALYLSATGDIGIGTNGPTNYGAGYTALTIDDTTSGRIDISSNGIVQGVLYNSGSTFRVGNVNPNSVALITDDTEQLIIDGSGNVTVTSLGSGLVKSTSGVLSNATAGVDYLAAYDAFTHPSSGVSATTSGLIISASSTIGNGSATGGLTVSGNSTTTGNAIATTFVGNGSSNTLLSQNGTPIVTADVAGNNIAVGLYNAASGGSNSAFGLNNTATAATFSSAFGFGNTASGYLSSAFGSQNTASNNTSMAFGASNNVSGVQAAAFGYAITNAVDNSVMIGPGNTSKLTILNTQKAGFGSTTPYANLSVHANAGETNTTLFAIGSSTASATSTLFSVSNTGSVQTALGSGLVKSTSGVLGLATVGTDYIAGGAGAATTTVTCAGTASCTGFVAFGASPITITGSGLASYDAWTHPAAGQSATTSLMLFNGAASSTQLSATRAYFGGTATTTITASGFVGVGSSSPWAQLSVNPTSTNGTAPAFAIGSSTDTSFVVWNNGNVSIGTTTASTQKLTVAGTLRLDNGGGWAPLSGVNFQGIMSGGSYYFGKTFDSGNSGVFVYDNSGGYFTISNNNSTLDNGVKISDNLTVTGAATFANASTTNFSANTLAVGGTGTTSISSTGALTTPSLTIGSLSGLLKGTAGAVSVATPGTDYIAGGAGAATTTVSCSGSASCTSFVAFGSSPITISSSALTAYDAWTHPAAGQSATTSLMLFNGNASSTQLSAGTAYFGTTGTTTILGTGFVGVGTSSPWARLSINPIAADGAAPAFAIGSSTGTTFVVTNGGNVGIGTTSPQAPLHIQSDNGMRIQESSNVRYFYVTPPVAGADTVFGNNGTSAGFRFSNTSIGTFLTMNGSSGSVGIGTTTPFAKLSVAGSAGGTTNLFAVSTSTAGFSTSTALYVDSAGSLIAGLNGSKVGIGTTSPGAALEVKGSGTGSVLAGAWGGDSTYGAISLNGSLATGNANFYSNYGGTSLVINRPTGGSVSFRENNAIQMYLEGTTGNFGVGTSTPYRRLSVQGSAGISGDLAAANVVATGTLQVSGQTTLATSLSGLLKATAGVVSNATAGTDYIAGGAGAATTTLTISGPFTTSATPVVFGSSPITATYYGLATTSALASSQLLVSNGAAGVYGVSTTTPTLGLGPFLISHLCVLIF
jgi:putative sterol carrier protein